MSVSTTLPLIIQGGMGIGISDWRLARAVARCGQLGVVSGTAIDSVLVRRLQDGDIGGHVRRAMESFPLPQVSAAVLSRYFLPDGRPAGAPYRALPMYKQVVSKGRQQLTMLANYVEVHLAKEGHSGAVGINLLTKVQMPNLASLYGAMLAGVDYVLMGAGIPKEIPGVLDRFAGHESASIKLDVDGLARGEAEYLEFDPGEHLDTRLPALARPKFLPIISSDSLATMLVRKSNGSVEGFVVEGPTAGGHNAPPRGSPQFNQRGEPVYGERDQADLEKIRDLGLPFWLAGGEGSPGRLAKALEAGAAGIQLGTLFAYCAESGMRPDHRREILRQSAADDVDVLTDPRASPTGFPFKVVHLDGSLATEEVYQARERVCDLGYLRVAYRTPEGRLGYRCPAEPGEAYVKKGGALEDTHGRKCLCNSLMANIGLGQIREGAAAERPLITSGDDLRSIAAFLRGRTEYTAEDVIQYFLADIEAGSGGARDAPVPAGATLATPGHR
jgi:nitronate monooxygenase